MCIYIIHVYIYIIHVYIYMYIYIDTYCTHVTLYTIHCIRCINNSSHNDANDSPGRFPILVFSTIMFRRQGLMKCTREDFLKSLRSGLFCVVSISQQPNGTSHSLAALHLERVPQNDFYRQRAEIFN